MAPGGKRQKRHWWLFAKLAFALGLVAYLFKSGKIDLESLLAIRRPLDVVIAQALWFLAFLVTVTRWHLLLHALGVESRFRDALRLSGLGLFFSQMIPGATGGDLVRGVQVARESPGRRPNAVLSVFLDRVLGLTALMTIGAVGVLFCPPSVRDHPLLQKLQWVLFSVLAAVLLGGAFLSSRRLWEGSRFLQWLTKLPGGSVIAKVTTALWAMRQRKRNLTAGLCLSGLAHALFVSAAIFLGRALTGEMPAPENYFYLVPLGQLAFSLPLTPGGTGVGQWAYEELFMAVGESRGGELGLLLQLTSVFWAVLGALALFHGGRGIRREWEAGSAPAPETSIQKE